MSRLRKLPSRSERKKLSWRRTRAWRHSPRAITDCAISLLSHARASLPQDTSITDKLREVRAELMKKLNAEADAQRRDRIKSSIQTATASLEAVFAVLPPTAPLPAAWGDAMVVDLTDARTSAVDPRLLKGLNIETNEPLPAPPTGLTARPAEPDPKRTPKPTDEQMLAYFSSKKYEDAVLRVSEEPTQNSSPIAAAPSDDR